MSTKTRYLSGIILMLLFSACSEKPANITPIPLKDKEPQPVIQPKFVTSSDGLVLRAKPTAHSRSLKILPYRMQLNELIKSDNCEKIDGKDGCWASLTIGKLTGWVFDGYLQNFQPAMAQVQYQILSKKYCADLSNFCECATRIEQAEISKHKNLSRKGDTLSIQLENGAEIILKDTSAAEKYHTGTRKYRFERREGDFYIFQVCCWEWSERQLVNAVTGVAITTFGEQLFSPDAKYVLSFSDEIFSRNGIEIFSLSEQKPQRVFARETSGMSMTSISWKTNDLIQIIDANSEGARPLIITLKNGAWRLK